MKRTDPDYKYTPRGTTRKPCPGCGTTEPWSLKDTVCRDCRDKLTEAEAARKRQKRDPKRKVFRHFLEDSDWNKRVYVPGLRYNEDGISKRLSKAFTDLIAFEAQPAVGHNYQSPGVLSPDTDNEYANTQGYDNAYQADEFTLPVGFRSLVRALFEASEQAVKAAYDGGVRYGSDALRRLATGDESVTHFREMQKHHEED